jgi:hypothetical protein
MASQVLSGSSNVSYTNNTGQNVRIVINYMRGDSTTTSRISISWAGVSETSSNIFAIGRNLAYSYSSAGDPVVANNSQGIASGSFSRFVTNALPTELMLAPGQTFSASCGPYNIVVIPEAG